MSVFTRQRSAILSKYNEALCSSCELEPEKFHVQQENMMASMRKRGLWPHLLYMVFSGPQLGEVDTVPRFICKISLLVGLEGIFLL